MDLNTAISGDFYPEAYLREHLGVRNFQASDWPVYAHLICTCSSKIASSPSRLTEKEFESVSNAAQITLPMVYFEYDTFVAYPHNICGLFKSFDLRLSPIEPDHNIQYIPVEVEPVVKNLALLLFVITQTLEPSITYAQLLDELRQFIVRLQGCGYTFKSCKIDT